LGSNGSLTLQELYYLHSCSSNIQSQLNALTSAINNIGGEEGGSSGSVLNGLFTGLVGAGSVLGFSSIYSSLLTIQAEITMLNANVLALRTQLVDLNITVEGLIQKTCYLNQN
jgi:hypothetical protein